MPMTLEERERRAYIEGRIEEAASLVEAMQPVDDRIDELEHEVRYLNGRIDELRERVDYLESLCEAHDIDCF